MLKAANVSQFSFSSKHRLISKHDFQSVFAKPCKVAHKYLLILYKPNQTPYARLGIIAAKQRLKLAVKRNRFRRVVKESFRMHKDLLKGLDIIVLIRSECTALSKTASKQALRQDIEHLWCLLNQSSKNV